MPYPRGLALPEADRRTRSLRSPGKLLKKLDGTCPYPDGTEGTWTYERLGPACHRYDFRDKDGAAMPRQYVTGPLGNDPASITAKARDLAPAAFLEAVEKERKEWFGRATEPSDGSRTAPMAAFSRMPARTAKQEGGRYAVCLALAGGSRLLRVSPTYPTVAEANAAWKARADKNSVVACCSRLDRRWFIPRYNPFHKEEDFRARFPEAVRP